MDEAAAQVDEWHRDLAKEASTMALYVAVTLLAIFVAYDESNEHEAVRAYVIIWGTSAGLAVAHFYAFSVAARLVAQGAMEPRDVGRSVAQALGAALVAAIVSIPVIIFPETVELDVARLLLAAFVGATGFLVARLHRASFGRSAFSAVVTMMLGLAIAIVKNVLSGH
jgi:positive regulator of sigma E activity